MPSLIQRVNCPVCSKELNRSSLRKHRIEVHKEHIPAQLQEYKPAQTKVSETKLEVIPAIVSSFGNIEEKDPTRILLAKLEGCRKDFNGTKSSMQLYFSYNEYDLLLSCVKESINKKNDSKELS